MGLPMYTETSEGVVLPNKYSTLLFSNVRRGLGLPMYGLKFAGLSCYIMFNSENSDRGRGMSQNMYNRTSNAHNAFIILYAYYIILYKIE